MHYWPIFETKGWKSHILMEARECKMRAFLNGPSPMKLGARLMRGKGVNL